MRTVILQNKATSPDKELRLVVDEDENGVEKWREYRAPKLPPRRTQGSLSVSEQDPLIDFTWSQDDWSEGALRPYYRDGDKRYALAKGVDARWEGVLSLGMQQSARMSWIVAGINAERAADPSRWTLSSGGSSVTPTLTRQSSVVYTDGGSYSYKMSLVPVDDKDGYVYQDLVNPTLFRNRILKVGVYIKTATLTNSYAPNIYINDGAEASGTAITASDTDWTFVSATKTISGTATNIRIIIGDTTVADGLSTTTNDIYFDNILVEVDGAGDEKCVGMATHNGNLYMAQGKVVSKWNESTDVWEAVYISSVDATDITHHDDGVVVAFGLSNKYVYYPDGSNNWAEGGINVKYIAVGRDASGNLALWGTAAVNTLKSTSEGKDAGSGEWSSAYTIGSADRPITSLHSAFDTVLVGKEDGLWRYNRQYVNTSTAENAFAPISTEWDKGVSQDNFSIGSEWHGFFYTTATSQTLIRWTPGQVQDLTSLILQPRIPGYGGEVRALVASPHELWIAADIAETADPGVFGPLTGDGMDLVGSSKNIKIISLRQDAEGRFNVHTIDEAKFGEIDALHVYTDKTSGEEDARYLVAAGRIRDGNSEQDHTCTYRWMLPKRSAAPFIDASSYISTDGYFDTSVWHGQVPGTNKAFLRAVFWVDNLDKSGEDNNRKITVKYGLDGADSETLNLGTLVKPASATAGTPDILTLYFQDATNIDTTAIDPTTQAVGRSIQLRFELSTDDESDSDPPRMFAFEVHSSLRPPKLRTWEMFVRIGEDIMQDTGYLDPVSKTLQLSFLDDLEDQVYPIYFKHTYDGHAGFDEQSSITTQIVDRERIAIGDEYEIHRLIIQEADTSA